MPAPHPFTVVERYSATAQLLHWTTVVLVVVAYFASVGGSETRIYSSANDFSRGLHELLGMSVFALTLVRVGWRAVFPPPKVPACRPGWSWARDSGIGQFMRCSSWCRLRPFSAHGSKATR
jgi:cytochrome b561